jgi:hypothetical protein
LKLTDVANGGTSLELTLPAESESPGPSAPRFAGEADSF